MPHQSADRAEVAAALKRIGSAAKQVGEDHGAVEAHIREIERINGELEREVEQAAAQHEAAMTGAQNAWNMEKAKLDARVAALEEKLRKVQATLA